METQFYLLLSIKTPKGFVNYGQYFLGDDRETAETMFNELQGTGSPPDSAVLHVDLMETIVDLPVKINTIGCTLDELCYNSKLIAREMFRLKNLKDFT